MKLLCNIIAGLLAVAAMPGTAFAADWWWVAGEPGSDEVWFVDAATIMSTGGETSFSQLHMKRDGNPRAYSQARLRCGDGANDPNDAIRRFVCATRGSGEAGDRVATEFERGVVGGALDGHQDSFGSDA